MIKRKINIHDWEIRFLFSFDRQDAGRIRSALVWADAPDSVISKVMENLSRGHRDEGFTFSMPSLRCSVVGVGLVSSGPEFLNSTVHEITHVAQHIAGADGIDPLSEDFAYLIGNITHEIADIVCHESCPHCREED